MRVEHVLGKWVTYIHDLDCSKVLTNQEEKLSFKPNSNAENLR